MYLFKEHMALGTVPAKDYDRTIMLIKKLRFFNL